MGSCRRSVVARLESTPIQTKACALAGADGLRADAECTNVCRGGKLESSFLDQFSPVDELMLLRYLVTRSGANRTNP
jgi:hypothetical protein